MANPVRFIQETRAEVAKVVWPTRREVVMTTIMVFIDNIFDSFWFGIQGLETIVTKPFDTF